MVFGFFVGFLPTEATRRRSLKKKSSTTYVKIFLKTSKIPLTIEIIDYSRLKSQNFPTAAILARTFYEIFKKSKNFLIFLLKVVASG